jgi:molecular chaperone DnaK
MQGERQFAKDNKSLGKFILDGIPPAPRGVPQVEVTFDIDAHGILNVKAVDKATNKEQSIRIEGSSGISDEEKERMVREAKEHEAEDTKHKEVIDTRNTAEQLAYTTEKLIKDSGDKIPDEDKKTLEDGIASVRETLKGEDLDAIKKASEDLSTAAQKVGAALYQAGQQASDADQPQPEQQGQEQRTDEQQGQEPQEEK